MYCLITLTRFAKGSLEFFVKQPIRRLMRWFDAAGKRARDEAKAAQ